MRPQKNVSSKTIIERKIRSQYATLRGESMTTIKKISGRYILDVETVDGVKYLTLTGMQLFGLSNEIDRYIKTSE